MSDPAASPCCPPFKTELWDAKTHVWQDKPFVIDRVTQFFHIPLNIGSVIRRLWKKVVAADAVLPADDCIIMAYDPSPWKSVLYMSVAHEVPGAENVKLSGEFVSKVYSGPYHAVPKWIADMDKFLATQGKKSLKYYVHFASCPKCAKHYGVNYAAVFAKVK